MLSGIKVKSILALASAVVCGTILSAEPQTRWRINCDRTGIEWDVAHETRLPHHDGVEMSGAKVSVLLHYGVTEKRELSLCPTVIGPTFRMRSTGCSNQLAVAWSDSSRPRICVGGKVLEEKVRRIAFDGLWSAETEIDCGLRIKRHVVASVSDAAAYETLEIANQGSQTLEVSLVGGTSREEAGVKGRYAVSAASDSPDVVSLAPGRVVKRGIRYGIRFADEKDSGFDAFAELKARRCRIEELASEAVLETPVPELDVMYRLGKIRAGEAIFDLDCGLVHSPGGGKFYGGFWMNDNVEYVGPWFGLSGDSVISAAFTNMCLITMGDMTDDYTKFIPAAYMAEGLFKWRVKERGDAAMFASGAANFVLLRGSRSLAERLLPGIEWGLEFSRRKLTEDGVVASDYDELEGRYPMGKANLCTSCIYLDALKKSVLVERALGREEKARAYEDEASRQAAAIERHFGACLGGWNTYRYFAGYDKLRGWTVIPLCVGLHARAKDTMEALLSPRIWHDHAMLTEEGDPKKVVWDRSLLSAFRGFFSAGLVDEAMPRFVEFVHARLLGEHVPHAVEQYPFRNGAHLAAEGALFCRIFTEGLFGIAPSGLGAISVNPHLPSGWRRMALRNVDVGGRKIDITVAENGTVVGQGFENRAEK